MRDERGRGGLWFLSLDASRLPAVAGARTGFGLPYHWSAMSVRVPGRPDRLPLPPARARDGARGDADVEIGEPLTGPGH